MNEGNENLTWEELSEKIRNARLEAQAFATAEAAELRKLKSLSATEHEKLEREFWRGVGPSLRNTQPDIELPFDCDDPTSIQRDAPWVPFALAAKDATQDEQGRDEHPKLAQLRVDDQQFDLILVGEEVRVVGISDPVPSAVTINGIRYALQPIVSCDSHLRVMGLPLARLRKLGQEIGGEFAD